MKLFLLLIILLFEIHTDGKRPKKCFDNLEGYCRKKCKIGEIYEISCPSGKLCCVDEDRAKLHRDSQKQPKREVPANASEDYILLPTVTIVTIQI
ncbi:PREDICTED: beta-defensin 128 [Elephantulus edwardii]|uniref:beta-defensin 128 n=1 Tax=Elephantulus edwardii TaxID=28737 RepID=UPI0003F06EA7|nr:PREDICTED: beta-defensin 128 [Elephantulus edwardii]